MKSSIDLKSFNSQQREAITSTSDAILCLAGAGAGKTTVLINRIVNLVEKGADPSSILALTFTNAAAFEMKERYKKLQGANASNKCPEFRTFHGFCYNVIIRSAEVREKMGYTKVPSVCDNTDFKKLKQELNEKLGFKLTENEMNHAEQIFSKEKLRQIDIFNKAVKKALREQNLITFDMMCYSVGELFIRDDDSVKRFKAKYHYIFVDEAQDSDPKQVKFVSSFGRHVNYFQVADILQNIYQFRDCTNEFVKVIADSPEWKTIKLTKNYRSTRQICEYANKFSKYAKDTYRIEMEGQRDGDEVEVIKGAHADFGENVDRRHLELLAQKIKADPVESAVLCRTNKEVKAVVEYLKSEGLECTRSSKESDAVNLLNCALDNNYMKEWLATFLEGNRYADFVRLSALKKDKADIRWFLSLYGNESKIKDKVTKVVKLRKIASTEGDSIQGKLSDIKKVLKIKESRQFDLGEVSSARQLVTALRDQVLEDEETKLYCGTIHSSKGLEYDHVYVMGVNDKSFPLGTEEMNNLFYVAITRPKNHLTVFQR